MPAKAGAPFIALYNNGELNNTSLLERLSAHRAIGSLPQNEIEWVAKHGVLRHFNSGDVVTAKGGQVEGLHIVLNGHISIHVDQGAGPRKIIEWRGGDVGGLLPYSRLVAPVELDYGKFRGLLRAVPTRN
jgi:CRP-like cAMP-binding protein